MTFRFLLLFCVMSLSVFAQNTEESATAFAPQLISQFPNVRDFTMSETGDEAYITALDFSGSLSVLIELKKESDTWKAVGILPFSGAFKDLEPYLSPDGLRLYFASNRPLEGTEPKADFDIWYVNRKDLKSEWSVPINPGAPVNTSKNEFYPAVSANGNLYFTGDVLAESSKDDIFFSKWLGDKYAKPTRMTDAINTEGYEFNSFISSNESFLLFSGYNREDGEGGGDLYISFKEGAEWTPAVNLGPLVNSRFLDYCPYYDEKNNILYFTSNRSAVEIKPTLTELINELNKYENGQSRIYKISLPLNK